MKTNLKKTLLALPVVGLLGIAPLGFAHEEHQEHRAAPQDFNTEHRAEHRDLNAEHREQHQDLNAGHRDQHQDLSNTAACIVSSTRHTRGATRTLGPSTVGGTANSNTNIGTTIPGTTRESALDGNPTSAVYREESRERILI
jgi:hypothetical protein